MRRIIPQSDILRQPDRHAKFHLAKNIGLEDVAKPDIWLGRAAEACDSMVDELVLFLSEKYNLSRNTVDVILWRHGADKGLGL